MEEIPLNPPGYEPGGVQKRTSSLKYFKETDPEDKTQAESSQTTYNRIMKLFKILAYIIIFTLVLIGAVVSKTSFLLMTSQLRPERRVPSCSTRSLKLEASISELERISWSWSIAFAFMVPELLALLRSIRIWVFKDTENPTFLQFICPFFFESGHAFGLSLFAFYVLPELDVIQGSMLTNAVCFLPAVLNYFREKPMPIENDLNLNAQINTFLDSLSISFIFAGLALWSIFNHSFVLPLSCILISFGWWENFVNKQSLLGPLRKLANVNLEKGRDITYLFLSFWKIAVFLGGMVLSYWLLNPDSDVYHLFSYFTRSFQAHNISLNEIRAPILAETIPDIPSSDFYGRLVTIESEPLAVRYVLLTQILGTVTCYFAGKIAFKIGISKFSFALPLNLVVPVTLVFFTSACGFRADNTCFWNSVFPAYLHWECPKGELGSYLSSKLGWVWPLWLLAQVWVTLHIWTARFSKMEHADNIFVNPTYNSLLIDQSLALSLRKRSNQQTDEDMDYDGSELFSNNRKESGTTDSEFPKSTPPIPMIYACATLWHEEPSEMKKMLKSILRLDWAQSQSKFIWKEKGLRAVVDELFDLETHIFFDDAFSQDKDTERYDCNQFVKAMILTLSEAVASVHSKNNPNLLAPPRVFVTPYGGRLVWTLPGHSNLVVHLKNNKKVRAKKRWSQVMYMYYLLGHKLIEDSTTTLAKKESLTENTFILALDGDIDFRHKAVLQLVNLMKKNRSLGAACGRIHPVGSGMMVWYQKFEYAIGHWFQKATEHVIGCVLCAPGCFSLFRAKALMADNVMRTYTTESHEPEHYIKYDQGEDRWLCTLILQRGYRIEYSAASDAYTNAPDAFDGFFKQRRRWVPSTMANIWNLLENWKPTVGINPNISRPYMAYQLFMMIGSVLGPGSIFLMLIGAFNAAFKISNFTSLMLNFFPIFIFILVCYFFSSEIQLIVAQILSVGYVFVMVAVLLALALQLQEDGPLAPSSLFIFGVVASFIIAALIHPQEFWCLPYGLVYYITIPSMYLILIIYSLMNLNDVSWGTREVVDERLENERKKLKAEKKKAKEKALKELGVLGYYKHKLYRDTDDPTSCMSLFRRMCCVKQDDSAIMERLDDIEKAIIQSTKPLTLEPVAIKPGLTSNADTDPVLENTEANDSTDNAVPLDWRDQLLKTPEDDEMDETTKKIAPLLKDAIKDDLTPNEEEFWVELLETFLKPETKTEEAVNKMQSKLKELRNKVVFFFFMVNAVFVIAIYLLQNNKDTIHIKWPFGATVNMTFVPGGEVQMQFNRLQLEPIGIMFVAVFAMVIIIQFTAMIYHRFGTFGQLLSTTDFRDNIEKMELQKINRVLSRRSYPQIQLNGDNEPLPGPRPEQWNVTEISQTPSDLRPLDLTRNLHKRFDAAIKEGEITFKTTGRDRFQFKPLRIHDERSPSPVQSGTGPAAYVAGTGTVPHLRIPHARLRRPQDQAETSFYY